MSEYTEDGCPVLLGFYRLYGIRADRDGNNEVIFLQELGDFYSENTDPYAKEVFEKIYDYSSNKYSLMDSYYICFPEEYVIY